MLKTLKLINFLSHKKTFLEFHPNVNAIVGASDAGKTSILRGIKWVVSNRPSGHSMVSHWNRSKNGSPVEDTKVVLRNDKGTVVRKRKSNFNGYYIVKGKEKIKLEAVRMDVPEMISDLMHMEDVNVQNQMDPPFLLSESASDVARFLNKTIKINVIDEILGNAENKRKNIQRELKCLGDELHGLYVSQETFKWMHIAEVKIEEMEKMEEKINGSKKWYDSLNELICRLNEEEMKLKEYESIDVEACEKLCDSIERLQRVIDSEQKEFIALSELVARIDEQENLILDNEKEIEELKAQLPKNCPLCGAKLDDEGDCA